MSGVETGFSLGGNVGDPVATIAAALDRLAATPGITMLAASSFYRTPPWGFEDQAAFVNVCAAARTVLAPRDLLAACKALEQELGRAETFRWGPRVIDVDILYYDGTEIAEPDLAIPHRELFNRGFVLRPLAEIRPDLVLAGRRIADAAAGFSAETMPIVAPPWRAGPSPVA